MEGKVEEVKGNQAKGRGGERETIVRERRLP
jgi:hypothetical protein